MAPPSDPDAREPEVPPEDDPTIRLETPWVGSASVLPHTVALPPQPERHDTLDLPAAEREALESPPPPYVPAPVPPYVPEPVPPYPQRQAPEYQQVMPGYHPPQAPQRTSKRRRRPPAPPLPPAPPNPPRPPRRRRRRWPWTFLIMTALVCGCCGWIVKQVKPYADQWPATIASGAEIPGQTQVSDEARAERAKSLLKQIDSWYDQDSFTTLYVDAADRGKLTTALGVSRFIAEPDTTIDNALAALSGDLAITGLHPVGIGAPGGEARCGAGSVQGHPLVVCGWADHGSLGVVLCSSRPEASCSVLADSLRSAVVRRR